MKILKIVGQIIFSIAGFLCFITSLFSDTNEYLEYGLLCLILSYLISIEDKISSNKKQ